jgi:uncharacterized OB-fold protein
MCQLSGVGTVRAIVELHISSDGIQAPYSVAHVDVDGVLMFARVEGEAAVGDTVTYRCDGDKFWFADEAVDG